MFKELKGLGVVVQELSNELRKVVRTKLIILQVTKLCIVSCSKNAGMY